MLIELQCKQEGAGPGRSVLGRSKGDFETLYKEEPGTFEGQIKVRETGAE